METVKALGRTMRISCAAMALSLWLAATATAAGWQWIDPGKLKEIVSEGSGLWVIDLRSPAAYDKGHIEGSVNVPAAALPHRKFPAGKTLVLVDDSFGLKDAKEAASALLSFGHEKVHVLRGGIGAWVAAGYPYTGPVPFVRGITVKELKQARKDNLGVKVFDMTGAKEGVSIEGSTVVTGKDRKERIDNVRSALADIRRKGPLADIDNSTPAVLVFPAGDDSHDLAVKIAREGNFNLCYLIGGYEAYVNDGTRHMNIAGSCPTCPGGSR